MAQAAVGVAGQWRGSHGIDLMLPCDTGFQPVLVVFELGNSGISK